VVVVVVVVVDAVVVVVVVVVVVAVAVAVAGVVVVDVDVVVVVAVSLVVFVDAVVVQADQCNHPSIPLDTMPPHDAGAALPARPQLVMLYDLVRIAFIASSNAAHYEAS
jgi:hypothetical protein